LKRRGKLYLARRGRNLISTRRFLATGSIRENVKLPEISRKSYFRRVLVNTQGKELGLQEVKLLYV